MKKILILAVMMAMILGFSIQAQATLPNLVLDSLGFQFIYDTDLDMTWYDYTNASGTWQNHMDWASVLVIDFESTTYDNRRLPSTLDGPLSYASETKLSDSPIQAWRFSLYIIQPLNFSKNGGNYGITVSNGDGAVTVVPEPISSNIGGTTFRFAFQKVF